MAPPRWFDSHAHVNFKAFADDAQSVLAECLRQGVWVTLVGSQRQTSVRAVALAEAMPAGVYAAVGLHPTHVEDEPFVPDWYAALARSSPRVVAIGETGLDYYRLPVGRESAALEIQREVFHQHIRLASALDLPLIVHCREALPPARPVAYRELAAILRRERERFGRAVSGVVHCFLGTVAEAQEFLDLGFYLGFTGIVTFSRGAEQVREVARVVPLDRLLIETDAPYLSPEPYRGKRNLPTHVPLVADGIAQLKSVSADQVAARTTANAIACYRIPPLG